jgi:hypothetical protein
MVTGLVPILPKGRNDWAIDVLAELRSFLRVRGRWFDEAGFGIGAQMRAGNAGSVGVGSDRAERAVEPDAEHAQIHCGLRAREHEAHPRRCDRTAQSGGLGAASGRVAWIEPRRVMPDSDPEPSVIPITIESTNPL